MPFVQDTQWLLPYGKTFTPSTDGKITLSVNPRKTFWNSEEDELYLSSYKETEVDLKALNEVTYSQIQRSIRLGDLLVKGTPEFETHAKTFISINRRESLLRSPITSSGYGFQEKMEETQIQRFQAQIEDSGGREIEVWFHGNPDENSEDKKSDGQPANAPETDSLIKRPSEESSDQ